MHSVLGAAEAVHCPLPICLLLFGHRYCSETECAHLWMWHGWLLRYFYLLSSADMNDPWETRFTPGSCGRSLRLVLGSCCCC